MTAFIALRRRGNFRRLAPAPSLARRCTKSRPCPETGQRCPRFRARARRFPVDPPRRVVAPPLLIDFFDLGGTMERRQRSFGAGYWCVRSSLALAAVLALASLARAEEAAKVDSGDNAWMLTSSALVLMMTAPGLALFYGGLVRSKNVLSMLMQSFIMVALISIPWGVWGFSLPFGADHGHVMGGLEWVGRRGGAF